MSPGPWLISRKNSSQPLIIGNGSGLLQFAVNRSLFQIGPIKDKSIGSRPDASLSLESIKQATSSA
ncbi:hypothetical protein EMIT0P12_20037 [Pseudomonas sp. IT-P12]